jgi:hypothetical protein
VVTTYQEPTGAEKAGFLHYKQPPAPFDLFMREEGIPIYRGIGVRDSRELPLGDWKRMGGRGSYIQLSGIQGKTSLYVVEVPAAGALNPERHMYEERFIVLEGRGSRKFGATAARAGRRLNGNRAASSRCRSTPGTGLSTRPPAQRCAGGDERTRDYRHVPEPEIRLR